MTQRKHRCPCCGYLTLDDRSIYDICPVCFWEDDEAEEEYGKPAPERPRGPNHVHLWQARLNFLAFGASEERRRKHVRQPQKDEMPEGSDTGPAI